MLRPSAGTGPLLACGHRDRICQLVSATIRLSAGRRTARLSCANRRPSNHSPVALVRSSLRTRGFPERFTWRCEPTDQPSTSENRPPCSLSQRHFPKSGPHKWQTPRPMARASLTALNFDDDQPTLFSCSAELRPFLPVTSSYSMVSPSRRLSIPAFSTAEM